MKRGKIEFELKFAGAPGAIAALPQSPLLRALAPGEGSWRRLAAAYYDTPDRALERGGLSLRLREEKGALVQAVKRPDDAGAITRVEFECEIPSESVFPAQTGDPEIDELIGAANGALRPVARTAVDRWAAVLDFGGARIEFAVDLGLAESWNGKGERAEAPLAEAELELIDGSPGAVFDLGRLLARNAPVRLGAGTKLETAMALARGGLYPVGREARLAFAPETPAGEALRLTLGSIAARLAALQPAVLDARKPEGVHQMRVVLRRLQAVERTYRGSLKTPALRDLAARGKLFRQALGDARDWDVFLEDTLPAASRNNYAPEGVRLLRARAESLRAEAWARATAALSDPDFTVFLIDLTEAATVAAWRGAGGKALSLPLCDFAPRALDRARKKMRKAATAADRSTLAGYHPLRIALKKLRYPVQMFRSVYPKAARRDFIGALAALQDDFGALNDAAVAERLAGKAAAGQGAEAMRAAGFISGWRAAGADAAAKEIDALWRDFDAMPPFWRA